MTRPTTYTVLADTDEEMRQTRDLVKLLLEAMETYAKDEGEAWTPSVTVYSLSALIGYIGTPHIRERFAKDILEPVFKLSVKCHEINRQVLEAETNPPSTALN